jgi:vacuolar-type H+-ATPase subunit E/Vma4
MSPAGDARRALAPVRAALLRRAGGDAERALAAARADVRAIHAGADAEAAAITAHAEASGMARAREQVAGARRHAERARRAADLAAQRDVYAQWRTLATAAVQRLRDTPDYPAIRDALRAAAVQLLGPQAVIVEDPAGGVVAHGDGRTLDLRLSTIAARTLDRIEPEIGGLWA